MEFGCKCCENHAEHYYWQHLDSKKMRFYIPVAGDFTQEMKIPKKFIDNFKGKLSEKMDLKDPSGNIWHVELTKTVDGTFLQSGWSDFVGAHHLEKNDLLLFKYDGNSCFDVSVFDETCCEKAASYIVKANDSRKRARNEDSLDVVNIMTPRKVNVIPCYSSGSSHDDIVRGASTSTPKKQRTGSSSRDKISRNNKLVGRPKKKKGNPREKIGIVNGPNYQIKQEFADVYNGEELTHPNLFKLKFKNQTEEEKEKLARLVHAVGLDYPCFVAIMQPGSVGKRFFLTVPFSFASAYLPSESSFIFLQVPEWRKKWRVRLLVRKYAAVFSGYWRDFVLDNNLAEGDACLFQLTRNSEDIVLTVHIHRIADQ